MNFTINIESYTLNKNSNFVRLIEQIRQCIREREILKEQQQQQQRRKTYSIIHYIEHLKRCINDNLLIGQALFRFYNTIKNFSLQSNRRNKQSFFRIFQLKDFPSSMIFENNESKINSEDKISSIYRINDDTKLDLSISESTTHFIQSSSSGLMTKTTLNAINKTSRQRTTSDIEVLEHLLNRCENLRHLPVYVRQYAARSLLFLTYQSNTILTRQNSPLFLVYIIVYGQCQLLLETNQTKILGQQLTIGDVYGDDSFHLIINHRLNGLITTKDNHCNLIGFFLAYENYLSDMMKQSLLEQLRLQSTYFTIQWRNDILDYFLKWTKYKQYSIDEIIYGNEKNEHENLYFILEGQVSFICLLDFPLMTIKYPNMTKMNYPTTWRFLEIFLLSNGHYFGFESTTNHSWYLTRSIVDIISIPKNCFKKFGSFAPMIFEKLRQDFLDIYPSESFIRNSYKKYFKINNQSNTTKHNNHFLRQKINWIPEQTILSIKIII